VAGITFNFRTACHGVICLSMDQTTTKTPNPRGRIFLKIDLSWDLAACVNLSDILSLVNVCGGKVIF
jgi:hypothetical protein